MARFARWPGGHVAMSPGGVGGQVAGWPGGIRVNQMLIRLLNPLTLWVRELMIGINDTVDSSRAID